VAFKAQDVVAQLRLPNIEVQLVGDALDPFFCIPGHVCLSTGTCVALCYCF